MLSAAWLQSTDRCPITLSLTVMDREREACNFYHILGAVCFGIADYLHLMAQIMNNDDKIILCMRPYYALVKPTTHTQQTLEHLGSTRV